MVYAALYRKLSGIYATITYLVMTTLILISKCNALAVNVLRSVYIFDFGNKVGICRGCRGRQAKVGPRGKVGHHHHSKYGESYGKIMIPVSSRPTSREDTMECVACELQHTKQ